MIMMEEELCNGSRERCRDKKEISACLSVYVCLVSEPRHCVPKISRLREHFYGNLSPLPNQSVSPWLLYME